MARTKNFFCVFLSSSKRKKKNILKNSKFKNYRKLEKNKKYYKNLSFSKYEVKIMNFKDKKLCFFVED